MRRRDTPGAYFIPAVLVSLGATPSIGIFAKETCFQWDFLLNNGCTMRGVVCSRWCRRRASACLQFGHVVQGSEGHLHECEIMSFPGLLVVLIYSEVEF